MRLVLLLALLLVPSAAEAARPVDLVSFQVGFGAGTVLLSWQTGGETNNAGFVIEQQLPGEEVWLPVGFVEGAGTADEVQGYSFRLDVEQPGRHGFRLVQRDFDGEEAVLPEEIVFVPVVADVLLPLALVVRDDVGSARTLLFGLDPAATTDLDPALGESELPPLPPSGVFEARFVGTHLDDVALGEGTYIDFRPGDEAAAEHAHELRYQLPAEAGALTFLYDWPERIVVVVTDFFEGAVVQDTLQGAGIYTLSEEAVHLGRLRMVVRYAAGVAMREAPRTSALMLDAWPVPARDAVTLHIEAPAGTPTSLVVYDLLGRVVLRPFEGERLAGTRTLRLDAGSLTPGVYLARLTAGPTTRTRRLVVVR